jgi:hypothetical protein
MADYTPIHSGGAIPFTSTTSGVVTGGQLVAASGNFTCAAAGAASTAVIGVAAHDAASGAKLTVWPLHNVTHEITSTGTIAAGDAIVAGAAGVAATAAVATASAAGTDLGRALAAATGGAVVRFIGK